MNTSAAITLERVSRIIGYAIKKGNYAAVSPNLPQRIAIFAEANRANQSGLTADPVEVTSARQAGDLFGYGSPIHQVMRILRPKTNDGVAGIPTLVFAQAQAGGATEKILGITPVGTATASGTHTIVINGRYDVDGTRYDINIAAGDTAAQIVAKIVNAVNNVLGSPVSASDFGYQALLTTKWSGLTAQEVNASVDRGANTLGITYTVTEVRSASGTPSIQGGLDKIGNAWYTIVLNSYGLVSSVMTALETFNGIPDPNTPTGRYTGIVWKPFIAITGSVSDDPSLITDARKDQVTIAVAPAPLSKGLSLEAAANMTYLYALKAQNNPELDVAGQSYPDMPTPLSIGSMAEYNNRDLFVKRGCSTVELVAAKYQVQDFVTTYHPIGEEPPQYRYCRNLNLDMNVRYGYLLLEATNVLDHAIANNDDTVDVEKVVKPKMWKGVLDQYAVSLVKRALIVDAAFMQNSIEVGIGTSNPDRFETSFRYKRSGFVRQAATIAEAGFNFGTGV